MTISNALSVALQREGFGVDTAADGVEAIDRFEASRPSLVLLDVMLPKVSGVDVCRELRRRSSVPIIMVSAYDDRVRAEALEQGAVAVLGKPFDGEALLAAVRSALGPSGRE